MRIETERLIIRDFEMKDEKDLCEYMLQRVNEEFERYPDFTKDKSGEAIKFRCERKEFLAIELKENHKVIGNLYFADKELNSKELGYVLNKDYMGNGYSIEASKAVIDYSFKKGLHRVFAECNPKNIASWKVMEKIGMRREAHFIKNISRGKDAEGKPIYCDTYVYAMLNPYEEE